MLDVALRVGLVILARCGFGVAKAHGWLPQRLYVRTIMGLLKKDDLDEAVSVFLQAFCRYPLTQQGLVVRDIIRAEIDVRLRILANRCDQLLAEEQEIRKDLHPLRRFVRCRLNPRGVEEDYRRLDQVMKERKALAEGMLVLDRKQELINSSSKKSDSSGTSAPGSESPSRVSENFNGACGREDLG